MSRKQAESALAMLLAGCVDERLAGFTPESLSGSYNVPKERAAAMLADARRRRAA
jgi:hypothetical protein